VMPVIYHLEITMGLHTPTALLRTKGRRIASRYCNKLHVILPKLRLAAGHDSIAR
jgi:hypothetical protein